MITNPANGVGMTFISNGILIQNNTGGCIFGKKQDAPCKKLTAKVQVFSHICKVRPKKWRKMQVETDRKGRKNRGDGEKLAGRGERVNKYTV